MILTKMHGLAGAVGAYSLRDHIEAMFVMSTGRAGTTTITRLFELSPHAVSYHEPRPHFFQERGIAYQAPNEETQRLRRRLWNGRGRLLLNAHKSGRRYLETSAFLSFFSPVLAEMLPRARFLFTYRHPGDVIRSGMRRRWYEAHPGDPSRIVPRPDDPASEKWKQWSRFEKICWYWAAYNEECLRCYEALAPDRRFMFSAESLWSEEGLAIAGRLFKLAGISPPSDKQLKTILETPFNSQKDGSFPRFEDWDRAMRRKLHEIAGPTMERLGYFSDM